MNLGQILKNGITRENPTFGLVLGMCPTLAGHLSDGRFGDGPGYTVVLAGSIY